MTTMIEIKPEDLREFLLYFMLCDLCGGRHAIESIGGREVPCPRCEEAR